VVCTALLVALSPTALAAPPGLAPGPWRLAKQATASGRNPELHIFVRWSPQTEFGPSTGVNAYPPIPKRMAIVIDQPRTQQAHLRWSAFCYPNREYGYTYTGQAKAVGRRALYPKLYAKRVECDLYVNATAAGLARMTLRVYGY
jgi:hypothetical protein